MPSAYHAGVHAQFLIVVYGISFFAFMTHWAMGSARRMEKEIFDVGGEIRGARGGIR